MPRKIPPFAALRAFEAVARLGGYSDAAQELNISISAIRHQVRALEAYLGVVLLQRGPAQAATPTPEGRTLVSDVSRALDDLDAAFSSFTKSTEEQSVSVHMFQSLANLWLIPKLPRLREALPRLQIRIVTMPEEISLSSSDVDMAIVYADAPPQETRCIKLFDELIQPVCSPDYLKSRARPLKPGDLLNEPLIHSRHRWDEWSLWFGKAGLGEIKCRPVLDMDNRSNALQAAANGLGWAMDRRPFGEGLKHAGRLVAPLGLSVATGNAYYLLTSYHAESVSACIQFRNWMARLCAQEFPG